MESYDKLSDIKKKLLQKINKSFNKEETCEFYESFIIVLKSIKNRQALKIVKKLATVKPIYKFETIFNLLKEYCDMSDEVQVTLSKLKRYTEYDIDFFMLVNVLFF